MNVVELKSCIEGAYDWFLNQQPTQDKDWRLAREAVSGNPDNDLYNTIYTDIVNQLTQVNGNNLQIFQNYIQNPSIENAILLFLIRWNIERWKGLLSNLNQSDIQQYLKIWGTAIRQALTNLNTLKNLPYNRAFQEVRDNYLRLTQSIRIPNQNNRSIGRESIPTSKLLMVLAPDRFIAWDSNIAQTIQLDHHDPYDYELFNIMVSNFIQRNQVLVSYFEKRFGNYPIRRLIDMVLYTGVTKGVNSNCASRFIESILSL